MTNVSLYLIRHGLAAERDSNINDAERSLTDEGRKKTHQVAKRLHELGLRFDLVQTSPLLRAQQTAEILAETGKSPVQTSEQLAPDGSFDEWLSWFTGWSAQASKHQSNLALGIIGHEPDLSTWAEILVWGEVRSVLVLKKAGIIGLSLPDSGSPVRNSLLFLLMPPKLLI
jgi:phosphohistidine phosphatase